MNPLPTIMDRVRATLDSSDYRALDAFVTAHLEAQAGRAEAVAARNAQRAPEAAQAKREWVRRVLALLPLSEPMGGLVHLVRNAIRWRIERRECPLTSAPGRRFIQAEIRAARQARTGTAKRIAHAAGEVQPRSERHEQGEREREQAGITR